MLVINEREPFPIVRKLSDPNDNATYYVQAIVRNSITGTVIATVNLAEDGNSIQRFVSSGFKAPADPSGQGFYIDIVTKVYSDSGYTTQNTPYSDEVETYLVGQRYNHNLGSGGGGGVDISYKKIKQIVKEALDEEEPEQEKTDLSPIISSLNSLATLIKNIKIPEVKIPKTDLGPVVRAVNQSAKEIKKAISNIVFPKLNLFPTLEAIDKVASFLDSNFTEIKKLLKEEDKAQERPVKLEKEKEIDQRAKTLLKKRKSVPVDVVKADPRVTALLKKK